MTIGFSIIKNLSYFHPLTRSLHENGTFFQPKNQAKRNLIESLKRIYIPAYTFDGKLNHDIEYMCDIIQDGTAHYDIKQYKPDYHKASSMNLNFSHNLSILILKEFKNVFTKHIEQEKCHVFWTKINLPDIKHDTEAVSILNKMEDGKDMFISEIHHNEDLSRIMIYGLGF